MTKCDTKRFSKILDAEAAGDSGAPCTTGEA